MKATAIAIALGIALIVTMGPAPASAQTIVIRECGDHYVVTRYNADGSVRGVWNKQLSAAGTIYTGGKTWTLVEGNPDRFVSDGGAQLQVIASDATPGSGTRGIGVRQVQGAQSSTTLVSNTGQTQDSEIQFNGDNAQAFTTGSHAFGYKLTGVDLSLRVTSLLVQPKYTVSIHKNSSGVPGGELGTVTTSSSVSESLATVQFTASGDGLDLAPNRAYWVVIDSHEFLPTAHIAVTNSTTEDSGAAAAWSIADTRQWRDVDVTTWDPGDKGSPIIQIAIKGYAKVALVSAEVNGTSLVLSFDKDLNTTSRPAARQFGIRFGGSGGALQRATAISIRGKQVTLTVPEVRSGQVVTVSYTKPTSNRLKSSNGEEVDAFSGQGVTVKTGPAFGRLPESGKVRTAVYVTYTNADGEEETVENRAASADRETLWDYFYDSCQTQRSVTTVHDYSWFNADGYRMQARNGWKWVEVQNAAGDVTGTRPQTLTECANHGMYLRQQNCANADWLLLNTHLHEGTCPTDRTW